MDEFALLIDGVFKETRKLADRPVNIPHKKVKWYPVLREFGTPFGGVANDAYVIRTIDPATLPPPVPGAISDRQFFQQLAVASIISQDEAEAAVASGDIPSTMLALVNQLPEDQQFPARMLLKGATTFYRDNPLTVLFGQLYGFTDAQIDDLFRAASAL